MKKGLLLFLSASMAATLVLSCSMADSGNAGETKADMSAEPVDQAAWEAEVNADFRNVVDSLGTEDAANAMSGFDEKYGTTLTTDFGADITTQARLGSGSSSYPPLTDLPFNRDGAVYLSGGSNDLVGNVIGWVAPKNLPGGYFHGGALDLNKYDPNNLDAPCVQTAITKGAGYETANEWRGKVNVCVLNPSFTPDQTRLNTAQNALDYYCKASNTSMEYGFFKNYVNIFNVVSKEDTYTWYCTKVAWAVYNKYGIDIDSNSTAVDFTKSGLYSLVKSYYKTVYFYSSSKANAAINAYIADARKKIVLAEEILLSPYMTKAYEKIRE